MENYGLIKKKIQKLEMCLVQTANFSKAIKCFSCPAFWVINEGFII